MLKTSTSLFGSLACSLLFSVAALGGSVSGGGGGTVPANPVGPYEVSNYLRQAKAELTMYFNYQWRYRDSYDPRVYAPGKNIFTAIAETTIATKGSGPCLDRNGEEFDGSVVGPTPEAICISVKRLGEKLDRFNAHAQTMALVAHEISHKLGFDEEEADKIQKDVYYHYELMHVTSRTASDMLEELYHSLPNIRSLIVWFEKYGAEGDWNQLCSHAKDLDAPFFDVIFPGFGATYPFAILDRDAFDRLWAMHLKVMGVRIASCGQADAPLRDHLDSYMYDEYLTIFASRQEITAREFDIGLYSGRSFLPENSPYMMRRITDPAIAQQEIRDVNAFVRAIDEVMGVLQRPNDVIPF